MKLTDIIRTWLRLERRDISAANADDDGRWITVNGRAILIRDGENVEDVLRRDDDDDRGDEHGKDVPTVVTLKDKAGKAHALKIAHEGDKWVVKNSEGEALPKKFGSRAAAKAWATTKVQAEIDRRYEAKSAAHKESAARGERPDLKMKLMADNDRGEIAAANALGGEAIFDVQQGDRLFVPYGRYQHPKGLQIFDRESAEAMIRAFNSVGAKIGRFLTGAGAPVYAGHPDVPGRADSNPAAPALGWIEGITAENDGASFAVKWNADGTNAVANAHYRFYSAHWNCRPVKGGIQPVQLLSIGLTNNPRIPVPAIANDDSTNQDTYQMKLTDILRKLLGIPAENENPTKAEIDEAATALMERLKASGEKEEAAENDRAARTAEVTTLTAERDALQSQATAAANDLATANSQLSTLNSQLSAANDRATAERAARVDAALSTAASTGRVTAAELPALRTELVALENDDLGARLTALAKAAPKLNTKPLADIGGARKDFAAANDDDARRTAIRDAVDAELTALANDAHSAGLSAAARYDRAFNRAMKKHPDLFPTKAIPAKA